MKVLIVEDNDMNRDMLGRRLERHGHEVAFATDGAMAIEAAAEVSPEVIIMDLSLPVIDGWEATRRIREDPATTHIPVIALTAHAMADDRDRAFAAGCTDFLAKPVDFTRLLDSIARHTSGATTMTVTPSTLLLVDDDEMNRDMLGRRLGRSGYRVITAEDGPQALTAIGREAPDLVLLDTMMPDMSGLEVLRRVRLEYPPERLPVIMVTAKSESEDIVEALDLGANDYVTKPVDMAVVLARIRTQIARRSAERALSESEERYALALRGTNDGLWDWKVGTDETFFSPRWRAIMGVGHRDEANGNGLEVWFQRIHAEDVERVKAQLDDHLRGRTPHFESEHRVQSSSGGYRWVLARGLAVADADGRFVRIAGSVSDITEGKVADALTALPNRLLFIDRLSRLLEHGRRVPEFQFAVLFLDLDRFKNINDSLGHHAGDALLVQVSRRLEQSLRSCDTVARLEYPDGGRSRVASNTIARFGGDEFAIILSGLHHPSDATRVADRINQALGEPFELGGQEVFITASTGIALSKTGYANAEEMLRDADTALYRAKAAGRGRYDVFDAAMREQVTERLQMETDLRHALDRQEFVIYYQPIVTLAAGTVKGFEALLRWRHPEKGIVQPDDFIPIAEDSGLIVPIGFWVFREACRQLRDWTEAGLAGEEMVVAVNLSPKQLLVPDLVERLTEIAAESGVRTGRLELEITETGMYSSDVEQVRDRVAALKASGFRLSIDDFGTGYSSLAYLQKFPVDRLKIDKSFLARVETDEDSRRILEAIVTLAEHLNLEVVAEGVETVAQLERVKACRCGLAQGYYFSRPAPAQSCCPWPGPGAAGNSHPGGGND